MQVVVMPANKWWPASKGEWFSVALILWFWAFILAPTIVFYWQGIQRMGGFWECLKIFLGI